MTVKRTQNSARFNVFGLCLHVTSTCPCQPNHCQRLKLCLIDGQNWSRAGMVTLLVSWPLMFRNLCSPALLYWNMLPSHVQDWLVIECERFSKKTSRSTQHKERPNLTIYFYRERKWCEMRKLWILSRNSRPYYCRSRWDILNIQYVSFTRDP